MPSRRRSKSKSKSRSSSRRRRRSLSGVTPRRRSRVMRARRRRSIKKSRSRSSSRTGITYVPRGVSQGRAKYYVYTGVYEKTRGGLTRDKLMKNKYGKIVSKKKHAAGKSLQRDNPWRSNSKFLKHKGKIGEKRRSRSRA